MRRLVFTKKRCVHVAVARNACDVCVVHFRIFLAIIAVRWLDCKTGTAASTFAGKAACGYRWTCGGDSKGKRAESVCSECGAWRKIISSLLAGAGLDRDFRHRNVLTTGAATTASTSAASAKPASRITVSGDSVTSLPGSLPVKQKVQNALANPTRCRINHSAKNTPSHNATL